MEDERRGTDVEKTSSDGEIHVSELVVIDRVAESRCVQLSSLYPRLIGYRLVRRIDLRFVPASMVIYLLSFLDRSNIVSSSRSVPYSLSLT